MGPINKTVLGTDKVTARAIYLRIFVPAYEAAVREGELDEVPSFRALFDHQHRLYTLKGSDKEVWIFRLQSRFLLHLYLRYKKDVLTEINAGALSGMTYADATRKQRLALVRSSADMTPYYRKLITNLIGLEGVGLARVSGTHVVVAYTEDVKPGATLTWHCVCNPFGHTLKAMMTPLPPYHELLADLYITTPPAFKPYTFDAEDVVTMEEREKAK